MKFFCIRPLLFLHNLFRSSRLEVFLVKGVLNIRSKFTGEHPCRIVISIKLLCNFVEITHRHGCSPVNLLHIFSTSFTKNTSGWLSLFISRKWYHSHVCSYWTILFGYDIIFYSFFLLFLGIFFSGLMVRQCICIWDLVW